MVSLKLCSFQVPGESLKLKQLKALIDEHAPSVFSELSSTKDSLAYLKRKVWTSSSCASIFAAINGRDNP